MGPIAEEQERGRNDRGKFNEMGPLPALQAPRAKYPRQSSATSIAGGTMIAVKDWLAPG